MLAPASISTAGVPVQNAKCMNKPLRPGRVQKPLTGKRHRVPKAANLSAKVKCSFSFHAAASEASRALPVFRGVGLVTGRANTLYSTKDTHMHWYGEDTVTIFAHRYG